MMRLIALILLLPSTLAFAPKAVSHSSLQTLRMSEAEAAVSPFDAYEQSDSQELAFNDVKIGTGDSVENGKLLTVKYQARLMASGTKFDFSDAYVFRIGEGKVLPGWEKGLQVRP